jgi:aryl-alcohol dehydrogenase-like predicted oxidoreductase
MISGRATPQGTAKFSQSKPAANGHWRQDLGVTLSSVGMGTYLGKWDDATDAAVAQAARRVIGKGVNVLDSAINYRFQRGERSLGRALQDGIAAGEFARDQILICTKGGYLSFEGQPPADARVWFEQTFVDEGIATFDDLVDDSHCMAPAYLRHEVDQSRKNLGVETIDVYYVHNPEGQLPAVGEKEFDRRLTAAFRELEKCADEGKLASYGVATWNGFRQIQGADRLSLERVIACAREAGGEKHRFRVVQLPLNLGMPEALLVPTQEFGGKAVPFLTAAKQLGVTVFTSVPLLQGQLLGRLPAPVREKFPGLTTDAARAIQFARSAPGVTAPLVGMKTAAHIDENLAVVAVPPLSSGEFGLLMRHP